MNKYTRQEFTEEQELEIIEYYKTHTDCNTASHFHVHFDPRILAILNKHNIPRHTKEESKLLKTKVITDTFITKYGVNNPMQLSEVKEKSRQTNLARYGVEVSTKNKNVVTKMVKTNLEKYGVAYQARREEANEKRKQTCLERYGVEHTGQIQEANVKRHATMVARYGVEYPAQSNVLNQKIMNTKIERYGQVYMAAKYTADNLLFDSLPELCFYLYHKSIGSDIVRSPIKLAYMLDGKERHYFPDFCVNGQLIEIKGDQFLAEDGSWKNIFDDDDAIVKAKFDCAIANNVKILYAKDYQQYLD